MTNTQRILTGHRPTGPRHLGHLVGTLETWAKLQHEHECYFLIADLHVLTTDFAHPQNIRRNVQEMLFDWLAAGIDPQRAALVLQSALPEHAQLSMLLGMLVTVARLERVPSYKNQARELHLQPSLGLLTYPVLQAADILLYKATAVPVGEDQLPHIELTREVARRFNKLYGNTFPEPEALLSTQPRLPGIDHRVMHTSYGNAIFLKDSPEVTREKVLRMYTDPTRIHADDPGRVEGNPVFTYLDTFGCEPERIAELKSLYAAGKVGDVEVKQYAVQVINRALEPLRARRQEIASQPHAALELLHIGTQRARPVVQATLAEVMDRMGLDASRDLQSAAETASLAGTFC